MRERSLWFLFDALPGSLLNAKKMWFRNKPKSLTTLKAHAPHGLFDLHSHVMPGVDDGARDFEEADAMLDALCTIGFEKVACTPHFDCIKGEPSVAVQSGRIARLRERRGDRKPKVTSGAESVFDDFFVRREASGGVPGIDGQSIYLVELGFLPGSVTEGMTERVFRLQAEDKQLLLAHPERVPDIQRNPENAERLRRLGMLMQLDVMSLIGRYGRTAKETALLLLEKGLIDLAATDLHRLDDTGMLISALFALLEWDDAAFERLVSVNPSLVFEGRMEEVGRDA